MSALGSMLLSAKAARQVCEILTPEMFYSPAHRTIFASMRETVERGGVPDLVLLSTALKASGELARVGGAEYLVQVAETVPSPANAGPYAAIVRDFWVKREAAARCRSLAAAAEGEATAPEVLRSLSTVGNRLTRGSQDVVRIQDVEVDDVKDLAGVTTGYPVVDKSNEMGGYPKAEVTYVMAATGVGKSAWMSWSAMFAARSETVRGAVLFASYEMKAAIVKRRMLKHLTGMFSRGLNLEASAQWDDALGVLDDPYGLDLLIFDPSNRDTVENSVDELIGWVLAEQDIRAVDAV